MLSVEIEIDSEPEKPSDHAVHSLGVELEVIWDERKLNASTCDIVLRFISVFTKQLNSISLVWIRIPL
jgi:hypothetical protein